MAATLLLLQQIITYRANSLKQTDGKQSSEASDSRDDRSQQRQKWQPGQADQY